MPCNKLTNDLLADACAARPKTGLAHGSKAVIINIADRDMAGSTVSGAQITDLVLEAGATGYSLSYIKQLASTTSEYAPDAENYSGFNHGFVGRLPVASKEAAETVKSLSQGRFIVVVERAYSGEDKYAVYGWEVGLDASAIVASSNENSGGINFTLSSPENATESYPYMTFYETDEATSKTAFDALFASV